MRKHPFRTCRRLAGCRRSRPRSDCRTSSPQFQRLPRIMPSGLRSVYGNGAILQCLRNAGPRENRNPGRSDRGRRKTCPHAEKSREQKPRGLPPGTARVPRADYAPLSAESDSLIVQKRAGRPRSASTLRQPFADCAGLRSNSRARLLTVGFTLRGARVRVITARPASRKERRIYEER
jgi:hypothetical protein